MALAERVAARGDEVATRADVGLHDDAPPNLKPLTDVIVDLGDDEAAAAATRGDSRADVGDESKSSKRNERWRAPLLVIELTGDIILPIKTRQHWRSRIQYYTSCNTQIKINADQKF